MEHLIEQLTVVCGADKVKRDEPMSAHTTFRIGGTADVWIEPSGEDGLCEAVALCRKAGVPFVVIGNGSNLLVSDDGYRGVVICLRRGLEKLEIEGNIIRAEAGVLLARVASEAMKTGLAGLEFASGIPGCIGGAVVMNAGAYGGEIKDCITQAEIVTADGEVKLLSAEELKLSYRHSILMEEKGIVTRAWFSFPIGSKLYILSNIEMLNRKRKEKQPLEYPSAGSTFKRPEGYFAGKLIMDAGLAGMQIGGAAVSEKHCGFVINKEGATATDIYRLMQYVTERVEAVSGVRLEPEVKLLGNFSA